MRFMLAAVLALWQSLAVHGEAPLPVAKASVRIDVPKGNGVTSHGSGTVVARWTDDNGKPACVVLTNRHVCPTGSCKIIVRWPWDTWTAEATWLGCDDRADLAALACLAPADLSVCEPASEPPAAGEQLHQVGYPRTVGPCARRGPALAWTGARVPEGAAVFHAQVRSAEGYATMNGDSGSGLFNDRHELVAVLWGGDGATCSCVDVHEVRRFLIGRLRLGRLFPRLAP